MTQVLPLPCEHVVATDFDDGEGVLIDLDAKRYYQLNETAMLIWRGLEKNLSLAEIIGKLTDVFDVGAEHAAMSVERLLRDLQDCKLVRPH